MKKYFSLSLILFSSFLLAQSEWNSLFPFKSGESKFDVITKKESDSTFVYSGKETDAKTNFNNHNFDYLDKPVNLSIIHLEYNKNPFFKGNSSEIKLKIADDKLYKQLYVLKYKDYNKMKSQYDSLLEIVPKKYAFTEPFTIFKEKSKEKIGEGLVFLEKQEMEQGDKLNYLKISYKFRYKIIDNEETNLIESYTIEVNVLDLTESRLTGEGF